MIIGPHKLSVYVMYAAIPARMRKMKYIGLRITILSSVFM